MYTVQYTVRHTVSEVGVSLDISFVGKTVLVTGGSSGIGLATVQAFQSSGGNVVFTGLEAPKDLESEALIPGTFYKQVDVTNEESVHQLAEYLDKVHGGCDILFNNAGILIPGLLHETDYETWQKTINVNVNGVFLVSKYILPQMMRKNSGAIINTSSISGLHADNTFASYNASKGAIANLTRNMAVDYAEFGIRVNAVAPGSIKTSMYTNFGPLVGGLDILDYGTSLAYPMGRPGYPSEVANAVLFLASDQASWITGINLLVDGGITAHTGAQHQWQNVKILMERKEQNL